MPLVALEHRVSLSSKGSQIGSQADKREAYVQVCNYKHRTRVELAQLSTDAGALTKRCQVLQNPATETQRSPYSLQAMFIYFIRKNRICTTMLGRISNMIAW